MAMKSFTIADGVIREGDCGSCRVDCLPVYDPGCESTGPQCCEPECPPAPCHSFRARDAIKLEPSEGERLFDIRYDCRGQSFEWLRRSVIMRLRRVSSCRWQWDMCALSYTQNGLVRFRWPNGFLKAPPGYYEGEIVIGGKVTQKVYFLKPFIITNIQATEPVMQACHDPCGPYETECCIPEMEQSCFEPQPGTCGVCDDRCD